METKQGRRRLAWPGTILGYYPNNPAMFSIQQSKEEYLVVQRLQFS